MRYIVAVGGHFEQALTFVPDHDGPRQGAIGAARREVPYWPLLDLKRMPWGRLCLWFEDEEDAAREMGRQLEEEFPQVLPHGIVRRLRQIDVSEQARVVKVRFSELLVFQLQKITAGAGGVPAPAALMAEEFDVARVVRQAYPRSYELTVVTERALAEGRVRCSRGRELVFEAA